MYAGGISYKFIEQSKPDFKEFTFDAKKIANETYEELINNPDRTTEDVIEEQNLAATQSAFAEDGHCMTMEHIHMCKMGYS